MKTEAGTLAYLAPEVWSQTSQYSSPFQLDVWALGVILYALTQGKLPFSRADKAVVDRLYKQNLAFDGNPTAELKRLILGMLHPDPRKRLNLSDVMNAPWIKAGKPWHLKEMPEQPPSKPLNAILQGTVIQENHREADQISVQDGAVLNTQRSEMNTRKYAPVSGDDDNDRKREPSGSKNTTIQKVPARQPRS